MTSGSGAARSITIPAPAAWGRTRLRFVVDPRCACMAWKALRVCDASVFPNLIAGNTNAPAIMVGWRGAEIILEDGRG
jgi:choline dehydrogenase